MQATKPQILENAKKIQAAMVSGESSIISKNGKEYPFKKFAQSKVRYLDVQDYRYVEQNPNKLTQWADMVRKGHQVMWVIHLPSNTWVARVLDGEVQVL